MKATSHITCTFDTALPQDWVNEITAAGFDPRGEVVWGYPKGSLGGLPIPLSAIAAHKLLSHKQHFSARFLIDTWYTCGVPVEVYFSALQPLDNATNIV